MAKGASKLSSGGTVRTDKSFTNPMYDANNDGTWQSFAVSFGPLPSSDERQKLNGYIGTGNSWKINEKLYDKTAGDLTAREQKTVDAMDKAIDTHSIPHDGVLTRYVDDKAIQNTLGLSDSQMNMLINAATVGASPDEVAQINKALAGSSSFSPSFNSTSAVTAHLFDDKRWRREISVPKGTKAFAPAWNTVEHEVVLGRNLHTVVDSISFSDDGKIVIHEHFDHYGE